MGNKILKITLKFFITLVFILTTCISYAKDHKQYKAYDKLFNSINKKRYGLSKSNINATQNPFALSKTMEYKKEKKKKNDTNNTIKKAEPYNLIGIISDRININGKWYKIGDVINNYEIIKINNHNAILQNGDKKLELRLNKGKNGVVIKIN